MTFRKKRYIRFWAGLMLLCIGLFGGLSLVLPTGSMIVRPGSALEITGLLNIPPEYQKESGQLYLTGVETESATLFDWMAAHFISDRETRPKATVVPAGISEDVYRGILRSLVEESTRVAAVVALREAGYEVSIQRQGARVEGVLPESPSWDRLKVGDIIIEVDGIGIEGVDELVNTLEGKQIGESVSLRLMRQGDMIQVDTGTMESSAAPGRAALGILVSSYVVEVDLPFPVEVDTTYVVGPSAGLMFALAVYDRITPGDLTHGHLIAGTGTLSSSGEVGPVGEVRLKAIAAQRYGARFFFLPRANYANLEPNMFQSMQMVPVESFAEAKGFLTALD